MTFCLPQRIPQGDEDDGDGAIPLRPFEEQRPIPPFVATSEREEASGGTLIDRALPLDAPLQAFDKPLRTYEEFQDAVSHRSQFLKPQLAKAAAFLIKYPNEVVFDTLRNLAYRAGVSPSTFVRLAHNFGFSRFSHLRKLFEQRLLSSAAAGVARREIDTLSDVVQTAEQALKKVDVLASGAAITRAVRILAPADTIFLVGLSPMPALMSSLRRGLTSAGIRHLVVDQVPGMVSEMMAFATPADAAVVAGSGPTDPETQAIIDGLATCNVPFVTFGEGVGQAWSSHSQVHFDLADDRHCSYGLSIAALCLTTSLVHSLSFHRASSRIGIDLVTGNGSSG